MTLPAGFLPPTELERRQIFYWLKRISSYTAWNRILSYHRRWVTVAERSVQIASDKGWIIRRNAEGKAISGIPHPRAGDLIQFDESGINDSQLIAMLKAQAHFEEGVNRLRQGDKRVFQYNAYGEFVMGLKEVDHWSHFLWRMETDGAAIDEEHTPLWEEFKAALDPLERAAKECSGEIIENRFEQKPARTFLEESTREKLQAMRFPDPLPPVPEHRTELLIPTGQQIPCSGLWEPIDAPAKKNLSLIRGGDTPSGPFTPVGRMAYLHGNNPARTRYDDDDRFGKPCTWRLIWRDDRYEDGTIPAEEADYVFQQPQTPVPTPTTAPVAATDTLTAESGQPAPKTGRWLVVEDLTASTTIAAGTRLPQHRGRSVQWVLAQD